MTPITMFTGNAGPGISAAACAAALASAADGRKTLLFSVGPSHASSALLGTPIGAAPTAVSARLDALELDAIGDLGAIWNTRRAEVGGQLGAVPGDEMPALPGVDVLFGMVKLRDLAGSYDRVIVDAGPHDALLRSLALPDTLRWLIRLLFGLDRGSGRSAASQRSAILPISFFAADLVGTFQDIRVTAEALRANLTSSSSVTYVLRPDAVALHEAQLAVPALQLHGLRVAALAAGPLLPELPALEPLLAEQRAALAQAAQIWPGRPLLPFPLGALAPAEAAALAALPAAAAAPLAEEYQGAPALTFELPGVPQAAIKLTHGGDELVVRVGPYRRHVLLPEALRVGIRASRSGDTLIIRAKL